MFCSSCGAKLNDKDAKCPFCGTMNPLGAEAQYMGKLEQIREHTESLGDVPPKEYERQLKHHGKFALKIFLLVVAISLFLFIVFKGIGHLSDYRDKKEQQAEIAFRREYFPVLDELYAQGDHDKVIAYMDELYDKKGAMALYSWKHQAFYNYYNLYQSVSLLDEGMAKNDYSDYELEDGFYSALLLTQEGIWESEYYLLSSEERDQIAEYQEDAQELLIQDFGLSEADIKDAYDACSEDGFLNWKLCKKYVASLDN